MTRDLGDVQTPRALAAAVLDALQRLGVRWSRALEPSCGDGAFVGALLARTPRVDEVVGIELQPQRARAAVAAAGGSGRATIVRADVFAARFDRLAWRAGGALLVVGNPPWVTSSELGRLASANIPPKSNFVGLRGLEARTGAANFDLAEFIVLKAIRELAAERPAIAVLCKTATARRVLDYCRRTGVGVNRAAVLRVDAPRWFGAHVAACLLVVELGGDRPLEHVPEYASLEAPAPQKTWGFEPAGAVADLAAYRELQVLDGIAPLAWHQGVKHDVAAVLELRADGSRLRNGLGEIVDVEPAHVYPLLKSADLDGGVLPAGARQVIVTQRYLRDDPGKLAHGAPKLWRYLCLHQERFAARRSSVYRGRSPFAMFGIGPYAFAAHKVAVSGLHKRAMFRAVAEVGGKPVLVDDASYFVSCDDAAQAHEVADALNGRRVQAFISAVTFWDAKRPLTKRLLSRIDWSA